MTETKNRLSDAMRRLNDAAPQGASGALGDVLKDEFRRHHARRRRVQAARFSLIGASLAACVVLSVILLRPHTSKTGAHQHVAQIPASQPSSRPESIEARSIEPAVSRPAVAKVHAPVRHPKNAAADADRFVTLPTFDPAIPIDHLEMVRIDLPGRALQLVGFPVSEEIAERRVLADILLAQDGTPYALRLVRNSETKEQWQ